jgi:cytidylate kinase
LRPRAANVVRQLAQLPWFAKNLTVKVLIKTGVASRLRRITKRDLEWPY